MDKELWIIRHGETDLNKLGVVQGRGVNPPLNELGRLQSLLFYNRYESEKFQIIFTSSLLRAQESVRYFIMKGIPWEAHPELDEISWGVFEGQPAKHDFRMEYRQLLTEWSRDHLDAKAPGGESPVDVSRRQQKFIDYLKTRPEKKILICMHGRAMRIFIPTLLQQSLQTMENYPHHNLTLYKVGLQENRFSVLLFNNQDHLHLHERD
jgi:probable phosphoglycerate mutase